MMIQDSVDERMRRRKQVAYKVYFGKNQDASNLEFLEQSFPLDSCSVCKAYLNGKPRECGICKLAACGQHLRKKRRHPRENTWSRICDDCEDRHLYESYMKFELKTDQALDMQEEILRIKIEETSTQAKAKQVKVSVLHGRQTDLTTNHEETRKKYTNLMADLDKKMKNLDQESEALVKKQQQIKQLEKSLPPPLQHDFEALKLEDDKITKQLVKLEKRIQEAIQSLSKKERDLTKAYQDWESKQKTGKKQEQQKCKVS